MRRTTPLEVSEEDRALLLSWLGSPRLSARIRLRARIVVASAGGQGARALARDLRVSLETIYLWRRRYAEQGIDGLRSLVVAGPPQPDRSAASGADPARRARARRLAGRHRRSRPSRAPAVSAGRRCAGSGIGTACRRRASLGPSATRTSPREVEIGSVQHRRDLHRPAVARPRPGGAVRRDRATARAAPARRTPPAAPSAASAASALVTALEAFGGDAWPRGAAKRDGLGPPGRGPGAPLQDRRRRRAGDPRGSAAPEPAGAAVAGHEQRPRRGRFTWFARGPAARGSLARPTGCSPPRALKTPRSPACSAT